MYITTELTPDEYAQCYELNWGEAGQMRYYLEWIKDYPGIYTFLLIKKENIVLAWALFLKYNDENEIVFEIYVHRDHRGQGLGSRLYQEAKEQAKKRYDDDLPFYGFPRTDHAERFFAKHGIRNQYD